MSLNFFNNQKISFNTELIMIQSLTDWLFVLGFNLKKILGNFPHYDERTDRYYRVGNTLLLIPSR